MTLAENNSNIFVFTQHVVADSINCEENCTSESEMHGHFVHVRVLWPLAV